MLISHLFGETSGSTAYTLARAFADTFLAATSKPVKFARATARHMHNCYLAPDHAKSIAFQVGELLRCKIEMDRKLIAKETWNNPIFGTKEFKGIEQRQVFVVCGEVSCVKLAVWMIEKMVILNDSASENRPSCIHSGCTVVQELAAVQLALDALASEDIDFYEARQRLTDAVLAKFPTIAKKSCAPEKDQA